MKSPSSAIGRLSAAGDWVARQRHLVAIRDGVLGALPLVLVGSLFLLAAQPPWPSLQEMVAPYSSVLLIPYRMLGGLVSIYVAFSAAHSLAKSYGLDAAASGLLSLACFFIAAFPADALRANYLVLARLGAGGIFGALVIAIASVELTRFLVGMSWTVRLPGRAPEAVIRSFAALVPAFLAITATFCLTKVVGIDIVQLLDRAAQPLLSFTGSLPSALAIVTIDGALWLLGVHASAALATLKPLWESMLIQNMDAATRGAFPLPYIATQHFFLWFVWQGGSGATLPMAILLMRARSAQLKTLSRVALLPAVCNINEPLLFGIPVVLNMQLAIPFVLTPFCCTLTAYAAFSLNWVTRPYLEMPWTLPAPLGAFLSTGGDVRAVVLQMANLALGLAIYWPFLRRYDARLRSEEATLAHSGAALSPKAETP